MVGSWDNLRFFIALARTGTVRDAARVLLVDEATVRRRIAALEGHLGTTLFERVEGHHRLTFQGLQLVPVAEQAEGTIGAAMETLAGADRRVAGRVRVGTPDGIGSLYIAPALADLQTRMPDLTIDLITLSRTADLNRHEVDLAVVPVRPTKGSHRIRALPPLRLQLYAAQSYLDRHPPIRAPGDLICHRITGYLEHSDFANSMRSGLVDAGLLIAPSFSSSNIIAQARAVANGAGVALLPEYAAEPHLGLVPVLGDKVSIRFPLWLIIQTEMAALARVQAVTTALVSIFPVSRER